MKIKVRGWDTKKNQMYSPDDMGKDQLCLCPNGGCFVNVSGASTRLSKYYEHIIPMLWTGLWDKRDVEIFDHDYIQNTSGRICEVIWNEFHGCWEATPVKMVKGDSQDGFICAQWVRKVTVVGNSLANPEILTANQEVKQ